MNERLPPPTPAPNAIEARGVSKSFGTTHALADVNLTAEQGRVLALLGPNGAGKTTLVRILTTLLAPDAGQAWVTGLDVVRDAAQVRRIVGLTGQFAAIDVLLSGRENLEMIGQLCQLSRRGSARRAGELLDRFGLREAADRLARTYSGGMMRRLDLAASLIADPPLLVLDEPTTGLDPRTRADVWATIDQLVEAGTTVLLTTQYLEEADRLAHQIAVMDRGRIVAEGTSNELKARLGGDVVEIDLPEPQEVERALAAAPALREHGTVDRERRRITLPAPDGVATLRHTLGRLDGEHIRVDGIALRQPSLDDVFLALTGHGTAEEEASPPETERGGRRRA